MNIAICGSIDSSDAMIAAYQQLSAAGHNLEMPFYTLRIMRGETSLEEYRSKKAKHGDVAFRKASNDDLIKRHYKNIQNVDAILMVNVDKNSIKNYIGGNTFLEMGFAYVLNKPIYLLNDIPDMPYKDELIAMNPVILHGDLSKIS